MSSNIINSNTTHTELLNGETFTGSASQTYKFQGVLVTCITDQNGTLTIEWTDDYENWDFQSIHSIQANSPFSITKQNLGTYLRVSLENNSGSDQTFLRLNTRLINDVPDNNESVPVNHILFENSVVADNDTSSPVDITKFNKFDIYGNMSVGEGSLIIQVSNDGSTFYSTGAGPYVNSTDFWHQSQVSTKYMRLKYVGSGGATVTAHLTGK